LALSAAILASGQIELLAQHAEQAGLRVCINRVRLSVYGETNRRHSMLRIEDYAWRYERRLFKR
jgi:hypothetical protein